MSLIFSDNYGGVSSEEFNEAINDLQQQISTLEVASDVTDVVGTYDELEAYDTSTLTDNDIIKVLVDSTHDGAISYYRWSTSSEAFVYIGSIGPYVEKDYVDTTFANKSISNLSLDGNTRLHALKGYKDAGELLTDTEGLADVKSYAHSTFDLSKFILAGTPTITDDGVVSGFSASNYVTFTTFDTTKSWSVKAKIKTGTIETIEQGIFSCTSWLWFRIAPSSIGNPFSFYIRPNGVEQRVNGTKTVQPNTDYMLEFAWTGTQYYLKVYLADGTLFDTLTYNSSEATQLRALDTQVSMLGTFAANTSNYFKGSVDFRELSVTVDGIPVFSGNKTGSNLIYSDYTIVGSPTISQEAIASNFSNSNYLTIPASTMNKLVGKSFRIEWDSVLPTDVSYHTSYIMNTDDWGAGNNGQNIAIGRLNPGVDNIHFFLTTTDVSDYDRVVYFEGTEIASLRGKKYSSVAEFDGHNTMTWTLNFEDGTVLTNTSTYEADFTIKSYTNPCTLFVKNTEAVSNLNNFKIYADNELIYKAALSIPYTLSKTGSKIVDSVYRDRVAEMSEKFGYAPYYTLSDSDFTLPQGELYGLIGQRALVDSYRNGTSYYEIYNDKTLEQGGTCTNGETYTFLKPFADTNYVLTLPHVDKATTTFRATATGDFIAKGKTV